MANSRISDLNKITSLDPTDNVQGSGMFLVANKKVGCDHIEYRDLKTSITDHTVFTTGDQLNIQGNKTFQGTVTFAGGHTDGSTGPLTDLAANLVTTGQTLNNAIEALDLDHDADTIKTNLFNSGQLLNNKIVANDGDITNLTTNLLTSGQTLFDHTVSAVESAADYAAADTAATGKALNFAITGNDFDDSALSAELFNTGQLVDANTQEIEVVKVSLFATGQSLYNHVDQLVTDLTDEAVTRSAGDVALADLIAENDNEIEAVKVSLFATGQLLADRHHVNTLTADVAVSTPLISGTVLQASNKELSITGSQLNISGADSLSVSTFKTATVNTTESLSFGSNVINTAAATNFNISSPIVTIGEDVFIQGDLFVSGETVTLDVGSLSIEDKTIELAAPTTGADGTPATAVTNNTTADGAGIIVKSSEGDKTWLWEKDTLSWESNQIISTEGSLIIKNATLPPEESDAAEGELGEMRWDDNFLYIKTNNGWRRALLMDWGP